MLAGSPDAEGTTALRSPIDYLNPDLPSGLELVRMPVVDATPATIAGYGQLVVDPAECHVEIVRWPTQGSRPVDVDTGDQGGTTVAALNVFARSGGRWRLVVHHGSPVHVTRP